MSYCRIFINKELHRIIHYLFNNNFDTTKIYQNLNNLNRRINVIQFSIFEFCDYKKL
jgi:hypothetical protein